MKKNHNEKCVKKFREFVNQFSYYNYERGEGPLINLTFFLGAGFSYAFEKKSPLGTQLFELTYAELRFKEKYEFLVAFLEYCGYKDKSLSYADFIAVYYRLQMMKKHEFLQGRFWDCYNLANVEREIRLFIAEKFKKMVGFDGIDENQHFSYDRKNKPIYDFFCRVMSQITGDSTIPEGIRVNFLTTNYDYIIEKIIDNYISEYLPYYYFSYRGFTPTFANGSKKCVCPHYNQFEFPLIKLNGGFEIFKDGDSFSLDYRDESKRKNVVPEIILPCQEQAYNTNYFKTIFPKANRILQETDALFISGYSFPKEDGLIRFLLKQFAESVRDVKNKCIFYVDYDRYGRENELRKRLLEVFPEFKDRLFVYTKGFGNFAKDFNKLKASYEV